MIARVEAKEENLVEIFMQWIPYTSTFLANTMKVSLKSPKIDKLVYATIIQNLWN